MNIKFMLLRNSPGKWISKGRLIRKSDILFFVLVFGFVFCLTNSFAFDDGRAIPEEGFEFRRVPNAFIFGDPEGDFEKMRDLPRNSRDYQLGRKVAHIRIPLRNVPGYDSVCTGFLVGPNLLLTNSHCIHEDPNDPSSPLLPLTDVEVYMEYYTDGDQNFGGFSAGVKRILSESRISDLDYALLELESSIGETYGWLELDTTSIVDPGQDVRIIHHSDGRSKEISRENSQAVDRLPTQPRYILAYDADVERGGSGGPVFLDNKTGVIAINRGGVFTDTNGNGNRDLGEPAHNRGTLMSYIVPEIQQWLPSDPASDLAVRNLQVTGSNLDPGENFTLSVTVQNFGTAIFPGTKLRFYRATDGTLTDVSEAGTVTVPGLGPPTTGWSTSDHNITLSAPTIPGTYYYYAGAEKANNEFKTYNNYSTEVSVTVSSIVPIEPWKSLVGHTEAVGDIAFSLDGGTLATGSWDYTLRLWDVATGTLKNTFTEPMKRVINFAFSLDGRTLATTNSEDDVLRLWDVATGTLKNTFTGPTGVIMCVAVSPDGTTLAIGMRDAPFLQLWDVATGTLKNTLPGHTDSVTCIAFSLDGRTLASGSYDEMVRLWDVATGTLKNTLPGHIGKTSSVVFSLDGNTLACGSDYTVLLWDVATGTLKNTFTHPFTDDLRFAFSPDGRTLARGSSDSMVRLWDVATGTLRDTLIGHTRHVRGVAFSPDGITLASASQDGMVLLWRLTPANAMITFTPSEIPNQAFGVGSPITPLVLPQATGGAVPYTYTLVPIPAGLAFDEATRQLTGTPTTAGTTEVTYTATDTTGAFASLTFTITVEVDLDVNGDGQVNVLDLVQVALFYGKRGDNLPEDINADGVIDVTDLVAVANGIDAADDLSLAVEQGLLSALAEAAALQAIPEAPIAGGKHQHALSLRLTSDNVAAALADAKHLAADDVRLRKTVETVLEKLLQVLAEMKAIPETTALLPNYPNPFNPETWIPYHLAKDADVVLRIYDVRGVLVRELMLGHQPAGVYESRGRAAYWDGKNQSGEKVASGLYFYTLSTASTRDSVTAGDFTATRKMLIRK